MLATWEAEAAWATEPDLSQNKNLKRAGDGTQW